MTLNELQKWMLENDASDSWWVAIDGEVLDNLMTLPDVGNIKDQHPVALVAVLHESKANEEDPEWIPFIKSEGTRFKVVSSRFDGLQLRVPHAAAKVAKEDAEAAKEEEARLEEAAAAEEAAMEEQVAMQLPHPAESTGAAQVQIDLLRAELDSLKAEVASLRKLADELKKPILEAHQVLEEREQFLEMSESSLFDKAQNQEVIQTELEQMREELNDREAALKEREAALQG